MSEDKQKNQFHGHPNEGWLKLPSDENKEKTSSQNLPQLPAQSQTSTKNHLYLTLGLVSFLVLILVPLSVLAIKKLFKKPQVYLQNQECQPGQMKSNYGGSCDNGTGRWKYTYSCQNGQWSSSPIMQTCDHYPHPNNDGGNNSPPNPNNGSGSNNPQPSDDCCSGTPECQSRHQGEGGTWRCVRDSNTTCQSKSVCKKYDNPDPSYCDSDNDCANWEVCQDHHCHSRSGCTKDSDCADGAKCVNGTCQGIKNGIECYADAGGVKIINKTNKTISGHVSWFASWCNNPKECGYCAGGPNHENITLSPNQTWTRGMTRGEDKRRGICDWQSDIEANLSGYSCQTANTGCDNNCSLPTPTPTPTPTIPPQPTSCSLVKIVSVNGTPYSNKITLKPSDSLILQGQGYTDTNKTVDKIHFTIFQDNQIIQEGDGNNLHYVITNNKKLYTAEYSFSIPNYGTYSVSIAVHSPQDGWYCTN